MKSETKHMIFMVIPLAAIVLFIVLIGLKQMAISKSNAEMKVKCETAGGEVVITDQARQMGVQICVKVIKL